MQGLIAAVHCGEVGVANVGRGEAKAFRYVYPHAVFGMPGTAKSVVQRLFL